MASSPTRVRASGDTSSRSPIAKPFSSTMSATRDFIVVTVIAVPSTSRVTVLRESIAIAPAPASVISRAPRVRRMAGDDDC